MNFHSADKPLRSAEWNKNQNATRPLSWHYELGRKVTTFYFCAVWSISSSSSVSIFCSILSVQHFLVFSHPDTRDSWFNSRISADTCWTCYVISRFFFFWNVESLFKFNFKFGFMLTVNVLLFFYSVLEDTVYYTQPSRTSC